MAPTYKLETIEILKKNKKSMSADEIIKEIKKRKNVLIIGKTPQATLYSILIKEIKKMGTKSLFKKECDGKFSLKRLN